MTDIPGEFIARNYGTAESKLSRNPVGNVLSTKSFVSFKSWQYRANA